MTKEQIKELSRKLNEDGNEHIMLVFCGCDLAEHIYGTYHKLSVSLAGAALYDDMFRTVFEDAVKMYEEAKERKGKRK